MISEGTVESGVSEKIIDLYILLADTVSSLNFHGIFLHFINGMIQDFDQKLITSDKIMMNLNLVNLC